MDYGHKDIARRTTKIGRVGDTKMNESKPDDSWKKNAAGIFLGPGTTAPHVEKAIFAVKVIGFAPPKGWDGEPVYYTWKAYGRLANGDIGPIEE